jgi:hypothetical protein
MLQKIENEKNNALAEAAKDVSEEALQQRELEQEDAYQDMLLQQKAKL